MFGLRHGPGLDEFFNAFRQQSQHQPPTMISTTNTKPLGHRAPPLPPPSLPTPTLPSSRPSPSPSPRTTLQPGPAVMLAPSGGTGTIRQSHVTHNHHNRWLSHHRGLSAVCPQDLVLRHDNNKRWDCVKKVGFLLFLELLVFVSRLPSRTYVHTRRYFFKYPLWLLFFPYKSVVQYKTFLHLHFPSPVSYPLPHPNK